MTTHTRATLAVLGLSVSWSVTACFSRILHERIEPFHQLAAQTLIASVILAAGWLLHGKKGRLFPALGQNGLAAMHVRSVIGGVAGVGLFIIANRSAPIAHVAWLQARPLTVLWALILYRERLSGMNAAFLAVGSIGVGLLAGGTGFGASPFGIGEVAALAGNVCFSLGLIVARPIVRSIGPAATARWNLLFMFVYATLATLVFGEPWRAVDLSTSGLLLVSGAIVAANTQLALFGYAHLPAHRATGILILEAAWSPILALLFFGEVPAAISLLGGLFIVSSAMLLNRPEKAL